MRDPIPQSLAVACVAIVLGVSVAGAGNADLIRPGDPRFDVFEFSNSAGDGSFASPLGTVLVSILAKDSRYCRSARFPGDAVFIVACREEDGWQIESTSRLSPDEAANPTAFGGMSAQPDKAAAALYDGAYVLNEREIIEAARNGWRGPVTIDLDALDAREIFKRTRHVYRTSGSYLDTGRVETVYIQPTREWTGVTEFRTAYVAPSDFRFESSMADFVIRKVGFIVWLDGDGARRWTSNQPDVIEEIDSVQSGLDGGAGISRDTSGMIPGLIFPGTKLGGDIARLRDAVRLEDAEIDGHDCFRVRGFRWPHKGPTIVWIDQQSFLIRRVYEEDELKDARTRTTWYYEPAVNVPVEESLLRATAPTLR